MTTDVAGCPINDGRIRPNDRRGLTCTILFGVAIALGMVGCARYASVDRQAAGVLLEVGSEDDQELAEAAFVPARTISDEGVNLIRTFEGSVKCEHNGDLHCPYNDASDFCTIGYGHLIAKSTCESLRGDLRRVGFDSGIAEAVAARLLAEDLRRAQRGVETHMSGRLIGTAEVTDFQYDALVSFVFNVGSGNFSNSSLLSELSARLRSADSEEVAYQFSRWVLSEGVVLPGLVRRRRLEVQHFFTGFDTLDDIEPIEANSAGDALIDIRNGEVQ